MCAGSDLSLRSLPVSAVVRAEPLSCILTADRDRRPSPHLTSPHLTSPEQHKMHKMYLKEEISFPPSPPSDSDLSGLKQLAEVSLATAGAGRTPLHYHSLLSSLLYPSLSISPSSSPSPPPAHSSPSPPPLDISLNPLAKLFLPPPQESPLDLRVERREMEEEEEEYSVPAYMDIRRDSVGTDSGDSSGSEADLDMKKSLKITNSGPAGFPCTDCGKSYSSSSNLARHRQSHRPDPDMKNCPES